MKNTGYNAILDNITDLENARKVLMEMMQFERLISDISARLIKTSVDNFDHEIKRALKKVLVFFHLDQCLLLKFSPDKNLLRKIYQCDSAKVKKPFQFSDQQIMPPWIYKRILDGKILAMKTCDLPPEAAKDKDFMQNNNLLSFVLIPRIVAGSVEYVIMVGSSSHERTWTRRFILRLKVLGEIITCALLRKEMESRLRGKKKGLDKAQRIAHLGFWNWDIRKNVLLWSDEVYKIFGLKTSGFDSTYENFLSRVYGEDVEDVKKEVHKSLQDPNHKYNIRHRVLRPDGTLRFVHERGEVTFDKKGKPVRMFGTVQDITELKLVEEHLRDAELRYRTVADFTYDFVYWENPDGTLRYVSPSCEKVTGYTPEELIKNPGFLLEIIEDEDRKAFLDHCLNIHQARKPGETVFRIKRRNGEFCWIEHVCLPVIDENKRFLGTRGSNRDITQRKHAEESLAQSERQLRLMADALPVLISYVDQKERFRFVNQACEKWYGVSSEKLIGKKLSTVLEKDHYEKIRENVKRALSGEKTRNEISLISESGSLVHLDISYLPHKDDKGNVLGFYSLIQNITQRKVTEEEMRRQRNELAHVARVSTVGEMAASLAHELNQPLTAILSNAQAALRYLEEPHLDVGEVREALMDIVQDNKRAGEVIHGIRDLLQRTEREKFPLDINAVINEMIMLLHSEAIMKKIKIELDMKSNIPWIVGDKIQLQQVIMNLVINGMEAMMEQEPSKRKLIIHSCEIPNNRIRISVEDSGNGIKSTYLKKIFNPFFTSKKNGLGMGLSISRSIIESHGGILWVENIPHGGAIFHFSLPVSKEIHS